MLKGAGAGKSLEEHCPTSPVHLGLRYEAGEQWANGRVLETEYCPRQTVLDGEKGPARAEVLVCHRAPQLPGRGDVGAVLLIMQHLSAQSLGYYLHRVLLRLGPKKIRRTAVGL